MEDPNKFFQSSIINKILYPYAVEFAKRGDYTQAEKTLRSILARDSSPEYFSLLGKVYAQQGKYKEAITEWKKVLEIDPDNQEVRAAMQKAEELAKGILPSQFFKWRLIAGGLALFLLLSTGMSFFLWKRKVAQYEETLQRNLVKYQSLVIRDEERYEELERQMGEQLVINLDRKIRDYLTQVKGLSDFKIDLEQKDRHIMVYGGIPTSYLKAQTKKVIEKVIKDIDSVESVNAEGLEITHKYTTLSGDTLTKVAEKLYGDTKRWKEIFEANQNKIKNKDKILPGITLDIP